MTHVGILTSVLQPTYRQATIMSFVESYVVEQDSDPCYCYCMHCVSNESP